MSILIGEDDFSYPLLNMEIAPYFRKMNCIENDNPFPSNISPPNIEQEEEISLFEISSSFNTFKEKNNFGDLNVSLLKKEQRKEKNIIELEDDFPKSTYFTLNNEQNNFKTSLFKEEEEKFFGSLISKDGDLETFKGLFVGDKKVIFKVIYPNRDKLFLNRKKYPKGRSHDERLDNIRVKIKRTFFNYFLLKKLNEKLKSIGSNKSFEKFPQHLIININRKRNKEFFEMTLKKFIENEELNCNEKNNDCRNYKHNLDVLKDNKVKNNLEFQKIIGKPIKEFYEEYINSDEFKINEINRLKYAQKEDDEYIKNYKEVSMKLLEFFLIKNS